MQYSGLRPCMYLRTKLINNSSNVAYSYFNADNRKVNFNANNPDNTNDNLRGRPSVQDYLLLFIQTLLGTLVGLHPAPEHSSNFSALSLGLKNPGFIGKLKFKIEPKFKGSDFKLAACPN